MGRTAPLLALENITQTYGDGQRGFIAVQDVNLTVDDGEFVALLGPSGCGKSTLLRIITGLQRATQGRVLYRGTPLYGVNPHSTIVFQTFALFPWLTVQQNVEIALKARGVSADLRAARAVDLLDKVGLDGFEAAYPRELSGGMRQKVGFARAMAVEPELLCMDEPFSALDVLSAEALRGELLDLWTAGRIPTRAVLMVTHDLETEFPPDEAERQITTMIDWGRYAEVLSYDDDLEEITGEIPADRRQAPNVHLNTPDRVIVDAGIDLDTLKEVCGIALSGRRANTLGGYIFNHLGRIPEPGSRFSLKGLEFVIQTVVDRRIGRVEIRRRPGR